MLLTVASLSLLCAWPFGLDLGLSPAITDLDLIPGCFMSRQRCTCLDSWPRRSARPSWRNSRWCGLSHQAAPRHPPAAPASISIALHECGSAPIPCAARIHASQTMTCNGKPLVEAESHGTHDRVLEVVTTTDAGHMLDLYYLGFQTMEQYFAVDARPLCHHHALWVPSRLPRCASLLDHGLISASPLLSAAHCDLQVQHFPGCSV